MSNQAQQTPGWGPPTAAPAPKRKRHIGRWVGLAFAGIITASIIASLAGGGSDTNTGSTPATSGGISRGVGAANATGDVAIDEGSISGENLGGTGIAKATLTITN